MTRVKQLNNPQYTLLENIAYPVENIDFIYFAVSKTNSVNPQKGESKELYWLSKEDLMNSDNIIKEHIKLMALEALEVVSLHNKKA